MAWSATDNETLKKMWEEGATGARIAMALEGEHSRSAVVAQARRMDLSRRRNPADFGDQFEAVMDLVIEAPLGAPVSIDVAASTVGLNPAIAHRMWRERVIAQHGGDPR